MNTLSIAHRLFTTAAVSIFMASSIASAADTLYFVDIFNPDPSFGFIRVINTDGTGLKDVIDTGGGLRAIDLDFENGWIYWCDANNPAIRRARFDGTQQQDLVTTEIEFPSAIAVDPAGGKVYWGDQLRFELWRANLDGSGKQPLRNTAFHRGIALDTVNGKIYWSTSTSMFKGDILRCNLDGPGLETVISSPDAEFKPNAIALDLAAGKVYWTDYVVDVVRRGNLDGTDIQTLYAVPANLNPRGITLDRTNGKVYWGQDIDYKFYWGAIMRMDLDGAAPETIASPLGLVNYLVFVPPGPVPCPGDVNGDQTVNVSDLLAVINAWGPCPPPPATCPADIAPPGGDGVVNVSDLLAVINAWGPCS